MLKKLMAAAIAAAMMVSFAACASKDGAATALTSADTAGQTASASDAATTAAGDAVPVLDFGGADYNVYCDVAEYNGYYDTALTGDVVYDAVYARNLKLSERFDVKLNYYFTDGSNSNGWRSDKERAALRASILASDGAYDLISGVTIYMALNVAPGCYLDARSLPYLDLEQPWWQHNINSQIAVGDRLYMVSGYYDIPSAMRVGVVFFSSALQDSFKLGSFYLLVYDGSWTLDKMIELGKGVAADLNGDGKYDENDRYGIDSEWDSVGWQITTSGYTYTTKNADGMITVTEPDSEQLAVAAKLYDLLYNENYYYSGYTYQGKHNYDNMKNLFTSDNALFLINDITLTGEQAFRDMGTYGILPFPKLLESQETYGATCSAFCSAVPVDARDSSMSAALLEAMTAQSYNSVLPAYYDIALSGKYLNDADSVKMLDLIYANTYCDFTYIYAEAGWDTALPFSFGIIDNYSSWLAKNEASYNGKIAKYISGVESLSN